MKKDDTEYKQVSKQVGEAKKKIMDSLAALHGDLCLLARLEVALEDERKDGGKAVIAAADEHYHKQVRVPTQRVWECVNDAITAIAQHNDAATTSTRDELPDVFKRNRFAEYAGRAQA